MRAATVMLPLKIPRWWYGIKRRGKPCVNCAEMSLQWGASRIITLPKTSRRTFSKFLSNRSFPYLRLTPKALPACWNMPSFDSSLLISSDWSGSCSCCRHQLSFPATNRVQYSLHSLMSVNCTSWDRSPLNSPNGSLKLSKRNKVKLKSVMFSGEAARPRGKYGTIILGSTSLREDGASRNLSMATCDAGESRGWVSSSMKGLELLRKKKALLFLALMSRIERNYCLICTSYLAELFDIFVLLDILPMSTLWRHFSNFNLISVQSWTYLVLVITVVNS